MSIKISLGNKKKSFKSIKIAADIAGISYMTLYMRLRAGVPLAQAVKTPVRSYRRKAGEGKERAETV
jgi:hypothetical protein